jgi:hypothetical protein
MRESNWQATILLAEPVRDCLAAYLEHRTRRWPNTINPHLFINRRIDNPAAGGVTHFYDRPVR